MKSINPCYPWFWVLYLMLLICTVNMSEPRITQIRGLNGILICYIIRYTCSSHVSSNIEICPEKSSTVMSISFSSFNTLHKSNPWHYKVALLGLYKAIINKFPSFLRRGLGMGGVILSFLLILLRFIHAKA